MLQQSWHILNSQLPSKSTSLAEGDHFSHISGARSVLSLLGIPGAALPSPRLQAPTGINTLLPRVQRGDVSQLCSPGLPREGPGFHSAVGKPFLPQSSNEISRSCCNASAPTARRLPQAHTGDFLREKEKDSRQGRNSWIAGTPLPGWSPPCGSPGRQHSAARGKTAFAASPGAMEGIFCSCPNQASLPNKAETGEAAGASGRFACVCRENPNQHLGQQTQPRAL